MYSVSTIYGYYDLASQELHKTSGIGKGGDHVPCVGTGSLLTVDASFLCAREDLGVASPNVSRHVPYRVVGETREIFVELVVAEGRLGAAPITLRSVRCCSARAPTPMASTRRCAKPARG